MVDAGTPEVAESVAWLTPVASRKVLISSAIVFIELILANSNFISKQN